MSGQPIEVADDWSRGGSGPWRGGQNQLSSRRVSWSWTRRERENRVFGVTIDIQHSEIFKMAAIASDPANGLDNYDVDDFSDDPFASPPPESSSKKRKEPDSGLGIDEEVDVKKRARAPNVKLDEDR